MAILFGRPRIYAIDPLTAAMQRLAAHVGRIVTATPDGRPFATSTAWYIAPQVVILPGFALEDTRSTQQPEGLRIVGAEGRDWSADAAEPPEYLGQGLPLDLDYKGPTLTVLRMREPAPERVLPLGFDAQSVGAPLCLVHFPRGEPTICASFGQLQQVDEPSLAYDADTMPGSSGAPILDGNWQVIGMHVASKTENKLNLGLSRALLLQVLQGSRWWGDIAAHHKLADVAAAKAALQTEAAQPQATPTDPVLIRAALRPGVNPKALTETDRETLRPLMADDAAARWTLRPAERRRIIAAAGTLKALQPHRPKPSDKAEPQQRVIDRILDGPPYSLDDASEEELGWWLQAVRWFEPVARDLPKPAEIAHTLERRRIRGRLDRIAGPEFQGRDDDLKMLGTWHAAGERPLLLTGIGGIGKSALVARFASELPGDTLLLWLDFDRPDLAPDDAVSVVAALFEQAALQVDGLEAPKLDKESWQEDARQLGERLAKAIGPHAPLLVLDSFEAAQYAERYQELWPVLEQLAKGLPQLRVCVTGRAPVPGLALAGKEAQAVHLAGLKEKDVRDWLATRSITKPDVVKQVVEIARGIPLVLQLAFRLLEKGGKLDDLPRDLPERMIAGFLHDRILDRVQNPEFKPLASGLLVLRKLTLEMLTPVLGGLVEFPKGEPAAWFAELSREMGLVIGGNVLVPRTEVRSATLWLLERDLPDMVREANKRAAAWYAREGATAPEDAAELVYHRLRLNDIAGAASAWRDGCGAFLTYAADDIRDDAARDWLLQRLGAVTGEQRPLAVWEQDAAERIRAARARKLDRVVGNILRERPERGDQSPLIFQDAYELYVNNQSDKARELLDHHDPHGIAGNPIERDRVLLRALLAADARDRRKADLMLSQMDDERAWRDRPTAEMDALAVKAARINLTVDLDGEAKLLKTLPEQWQDARQVLAPVDVTTPLLRDRLRGSGSGFESGPAVVGLGQDFDAAHLDNAIERARRMALHDEPPGTRAWRDELRNAWAQVDTASPRTPYTAYATLHPIEGRGILDLAECGWRRWWLAAHSLFLQPAYELCFRGSASPSPLTPSILGTLALFAAPLGDIILGGPDMPLRDVLRKSPLGQGPLHVRKDLWPKIREVLIATVDPAIEWDSRIKGEQDEYLVFWGQDLLSYRPPDQTSATYGSFLLFLFAPNPLRKLVDDLAGVQPPPQLA